MRGAGGGHAHPGVRARAAQGVLSARARLGGARALRDQRGVLRLGSGLGLGLGIGLGLASPNPNPKLTLTLTLTLTQP